MSYRSKKRSRRHVSNEEDNFETNSKQVKRLLGLEQSDSSPYSKNSLQSFRDSEHLPTYRLAESHDFSEGLHLGKGGKIDESVKPT